MKPYLHRSIIITSITWARCIISCVCHCSRADSLVVKVRFNRRYLSQQKTTAGHYTLQRVWMREQRDERKDRERIDRQACYLLVFCRRWQLQRRLDLTPQLCRHSPQFDKFLKQTSRETIWTICLSLNHLTLNKPIRLCLMSMFPAFSSTALFCVRDWWKPDTVMKAYILVRVRQKTTK